MFCPKCGTQNPDTGKFCRSCGVDLGNVSSALSGNLPPRQLTDRRGKRISWESAMSKLFMGVAFLTVSIILGATGAGRNWWFWLLIPAFAMLGHGIAQLIQIKQNEKHGARSAAPESQLYVEAPRQAALPQTKTEFVPAAESRYKTGDLVPASVTDNTTRHLEPNSEGETMTLPKQP